MDPETVSVRATTEAGDPAVRRRRIAVAGVSLMGAAAVSTAVFQTVTGTSTSLAMPDLASVLAGTASFPTPQGPAVSAVPVSAPAITDLGVPTSSAPDPTTPQVDLRANRGPLPGPDPIARSGPSPLAGVTPAAPATGGTPSGSGPVRPGSIDGGGDQGGGRRGGASGPTRPGPTTPTTTPPASTPPASTPPTSTSPGTTTPGTTPPSSTTPRSTTPAPTSPPGSTSPQPSSPQPSIPSQPPIPSQPSIPPTQVPPSSSGA